MEKEILGKSSNKNSNVQVKRELANASGKQSTKKRANQPNISQIEDKVNEINKEDITATQNDNLSTDTTNETYEYDETPLDRDYAKEENNVKGDDVIVELDATLEDLYVGGSLRVKDTQYQETISTLYSYALIEFLKE
ncbi:Uncharacterized protein Fot_11498 [Forsythia ovata]|uniref:Uncharacterized protein n=1 Tax=Forsythia ovata TaxID=205694 RepID=A0ABD1WMJ9_9LAMI